MTAAAHKLNIAIGFFLAAVVALCATVLAVASQGDAIQRNADTAAGSASVVECRARFTAEVSATQASYILALGDLLIAVSGGSQTIPAAEDVRTTADAYRKAITARVAFEASPTGDC